MDIRQHLIRTRGGGRHSERGMASRSGAVSPGTFVQIGSIARAIVLACATIAAAGSARAAGADVEAEAAIRDMLPAPFRCSRPTEPELQCRHISADSQPGSGTGGQPLRPVGVIDAQLRRPAAARVLRRHARVFHHARRARRRVGRLHFTLAVAVRSPDRQRSADLLLSHGDGRSGVVGNFHHGCGGSPEVGSRHGSIADA